MKNIQSYNQFLFEERRKLIIKRKIKSRNAEKAIEDGSDILNVVDQWIDQTTPPNKATQIADFLLKNHNRIKTLMRDYPEIYQSPIGEICYRGLERVSDMNQVINFIKRDQFEITVSPGYDGTIRALKINKYKYSPRRSAQSWSIDPDVPWRFSNSGIILETKVDSDFIMNPEYTSDLNIKINSSNTGDGLTEGEVIHLGKSYKNPVSLYIDLGNIEDRHQLYPYLKQYL